MKMSTNSRLKKINQKKWKVKKTAADICWNSKRSFCISKSNIWYLILTEFMNHVVHAHLPAKSVSQIEFFLYLVIAVELWNNAPREDVPFRARENFWICSQILFIRWWGICRKKETHFFFISVSLMCAEKPQKSVWR